MYDPAGAQLSVCRLRLQCRARPARQRARSCATVGLGEPTARHPPSIMFERLTRRVLRLQLVRLVGEDGGAVKIAARKKPKGQ